ncbi:hypothetical protein B0H14DRAFT_3743268 [Mycena olivaceomarginata]|nr:hypothetical protein B0H14DRAFT_3743268 [Mycena olivaceomarginata]
MLPELPAATDLWLTATKATVNGELWHMATEQNSANNIFDLTARLAWFDIAISPSKPPDNPSSPTSNITFAFSQVPSHPWFVGTCMRALAQWPATEWENLDLTRWVRTCTTVGSQWAVSADVLEALAALLTTRSTFNHSVGILAGTPPRLGALRLLAATRPSDAREVVERCLVGEEVPLEVQGVRECVLRIGRVETVVKDKTSKERRMLDLICARCYVAYCGHLAQLKVPLPRPLWSPVAGALAQMAQRVGDEIWWIIFEELQTLYSSSPPTDNVRLEQMDEDEEQGGEDKDPWEEERTW